MQTDKMWSWVMAYKNTFPQTAGDPYFMADGKTCVLPVKLEKNKTYAIWINTGKLNNFRDKSNKPAVPYLLVFKTR
jgi:RNA polymerase sigma-70 factor (ECF subfamily)